MSTKSPTAAEARDKILTMIEALSLEELAKLAAHEYDEEAAVPEFRTSGQTFLFAGRDAFVAWVRREGAFPDPSVAEWAATTWHRTEATGSQVAEAFVSLALYYSAHAAYAPGADIEGLRAVLDQVAGTLAFNLTMEYGPRV